MERASETISLRFDWHEQIMNRSWTGDFWFQRNTKRELEETLSLSRVLRETLKGKGEIELFVVVRGVNKERTTGSSVSYACVDDSIEIRKERNE